MGEEPVASGDDMTRDEGSVKFIFFVFFFFCRDADVINIAARPRTIRRRRTHTTR